MDILTADAETYFGDDFTLSKLTNEAYIRDPRFEVNIWGFKLNDAPAFWLLPDRAEQFIKEEIDWANTALLNHHAQFDAAILSWRYGVSPAMILDTIPMSYIVDGPKVPHDLVSCLQRHSIGVKDKGALFKARGKHLADFSRDELAAYGKYCTEDCDNTYNLAQFYLQHCTEQQLKLIDLKTRMFTEPVFEGDVDLLAEAVVAEQQRKEALLSYCGYDKTLFSSSAKFAEILLAHGRVAPTKLGKPNPDGSPKLIFAFAKTDPGMQELLDDADESIGFLAQTRLSVKSTIIETRTQRFLDASRRGLLPVYIKSNGTHTQRASAGDGSNWLNLTSVNKLRPEMTVIKRAVKAPAGCSVVSADSSQIQARLTVWLAEQNDVLEAFAQGRDVYSEFASAIYGRPIDRKGRPEEDFIPGQVGKIGVLSFGFQQGWFTAAVNFLKGHLGAPPIQFTEADMATMGIDPSRFLNNPKNVQRVAEMPSRLEMGARLVHCAVSNGIVQLWRDKNHMVSNSKTGLWAKMESAINAMIRGERMAFGPRDVLYTEKECIVAPSGARLNYPGLQRSDTGEATYWTGRTREHIYGGSATNNVIQLLEQEIIGAQMVTIHEAGYKVAVEVYDNIVCVVPDEYAEQCRAFMVATMKTRPAWGQDIPLATDSGIGKTWYAAK